MDERAIISRNILACLGDSSRFRLVLSLLERERCVTELAGEVGLSQSCTTRHLQFLEREGLVRGLRQGKRVVFRLRSDQSRVRELLAWVMEASPNRQLERVSGANIHADGPETGGEGHRAGPTSTPTLTSSLGPAPAPVRGHSYQAGTEPAGRPDQMEDWLL